MNINLEKLYNILNQYIPRVEEHVMKLDHTNIVVSMRYLHDEDVIRVMQITNDRNDFDLALENRWPVVSFDQRDHMDRANFEFVNERDPSKVSIAIVRDDVVNPVYFMYALMDAAHKRGETDDSKRRHERTTLMDVMLLQMVIPPMNVQNEIVTSILRDVSIENRIERDEDDK